MLALDGRSLHCPCAFSRVVTARKHAWLVAANAVPFILVFLLRFGVDGLAVLPCCLACLPLPTILHSCAAPTRARDALCLVLGVPGRAGFGSFSTRTTATRGRCHLRTHRGQA